MRFTSLIVELIRARPRLVVWVAVLAQAAMWLVLPLMFYRSPPGDLALMLAVGREYPVGSVFGPPLAPWLADLAFRAAGSSMIGVYLLAQICFAVTMLALYALGRALVGAQHAVLAVLMTMTIAAFAAPGVEFGPLVAARPLWALLLLHSWQIIGQGRRNAWFAWSIEAGLLLLTTSAAPVLLMLIAVFALATGRGRRALRSFDPLFALLAIAVLALPYAIWLLQSDARVLPSMPPIAQAGERAIAAGIWLGIALLTAAGVAILVVMNWARVTRDDNAPTITRAPVDPLARSFAFFFTLAPVLIGALAEGLFGVPRADNAAGLALLPLGVAVMIVSGDIVRLRRLRRLRAVWAGIIAAPAIAVIAAALLQPWTATAELQTAQPAAAIGRFFAESFERRTGKPLPAVAGDQRIASLIALNGARPHLLLDASSQLVPSITPAAFRQGGGIVVWRATDTAGTPPPAITAQFPGLVPEVPRSFDRLVNGRQPPLLIGWAIVRPPTP